MKADDDTYVIMENLKAFLANYDSSDPIHFGCKYKVIVKEGYMSGGSGWWLVQQREVNSSVFTRWTVELQSQFTRNLGP